MEHYHPGLLFPNVCARMKVTFAVVVFSILALQFSDALSGKEIVQRLYEQRGKCKLAYQQACLSLHVRSQWARGLPSVQVQNHSAVTGCLCRTA